jgi:hypothetical protein
MQNQTMTNHTQGGGATAAAMANLTQADFESVIYNLNEGSDLDY